MDEIFLVIDADSTGQAGVFRVHFVHPVHLVHD
jgi:hypothetical protein